MKKGTTMRLHGLDHVTINTADLPATLEYYSRFLKLEAGWRPDIPIPGAWLYAEGGDYAILHIIGVSETARPDRRRAVDHVAFRCQGLSDHLKRLDEAGLAYDARPVPETALVQVHQFDPNGITVELTFANEPLPKGFVPTPLPGR
jgi:catechol 2,3-dioxygenase-like lactoylglutathione lyase family enzyme